MNNQDRAKMLHVLIQFHNNANSETSIGNVVRSLESAMEEVDRIFSRPDPAPDESRVERAAEALCQHRFDVEGNSMGKWHEISDHAKETYRSRARAALEAAGTAERGDRGFMSDHYKSLVEAIWRGMESSRSHNLPDSGIAHRIANSVDRWLIERELLQGTTPSTVSDFEWMDSVLEEIGCTRQMSVDGYKNDDGTIRWRTHLSTMDAAMGSSPSESIRTTLNNALAKHRERKGK